MAQIDWNILNMPNPAETVGKWNAPLAGLAQGVGAFYDNYRRNKAQEIYKNAMDAWDYTHPADEFDPIEFEKRMRDQVVANTSQVNALQQQTPNAIAVTPEAWDAMVNNDLEKSLKEKKLSYNQELWNQSVANIPTLPKKLLDERAREAKAATENEFNNYFKSPEERAQYESARKIFNKGMTDEQKYRAVAAQIAPWDKETSDTLLKLAEKRATEEAEAPMKTLIRVEQSYQINQQELATKRQQLLETPLNDTVRRAALKTEIERLTNNGQNIMDVARKTVKGTDWESLYAGIGSTVPSGTTQPAPVAGSQGEQKSGIDIDIKKSEELPAAIQKINLQLRDGKIDQETADKKIQDLGARAEELKLSEGKQASAAAAIKQKQVEQTKLAKETLGSSANKPFFENRNDYNTALETSNEFLSDPSKATTAGIESLLKTVAYMEGGRARPGEPEARIKESTNLLRQTIDGLTGIKLVKATPEEKTKYIKALQNRIKGWYDGWVNNRNSAMNTYGLDTYGQKIIASEFDNAGVKPFYSVLNQSQPSTTSTNTIRKYNPKTGKFE